MSDAIQYGYKARAGSGLSDEILASTRGLVRKSITIDSTARDTTNTGATTYLRRGLMLAPDAGVGDLYMELDAGLAGSAEVVVLAEDVPDISQGDQVISAYFAGFFKNNVLFDDSGKTLTHFTAANAQQIQILPNQ